MPMTPVSVPRGLKKGFGIFGDYREDEATSNVNAHGSGIVFIGLGCEADVRISAGARIGGYMRVFEGASATGDPHL